MAVRNAKCLECGMVVQSSWKFCPGCAVPVAKSFESSTGDLGVVKHKINWTKVLGIAGVFVFAALGYIYWVSKEPERLEQERQAKLAEDSVKLREEIVDVFGSKLAFDNFMAVEAAKKQVVANVTHWRPVGQSYRIEGTVTNDSKLRVAYWQVKYDLLNENGAIVHSGWQDSLVPIEPGGRANWDASLPGIVASGVRLEERMGEITFEE